MKDRKSLILQGGSAAGIHCTDHSKGGERDGDACNHLICNGGSAAGLKTRGLRC